MQAPRKSDNDQVDSLEDLTDEVFGPKPSRLETIKDLLETDSELKAWEVIFLCLILFIVGLIV